jgi:L-lactate dehydrogenase complex protein LldG
MSNAREIILARLRESRQPESTAPERYLPTYGWSQEEKEQRFTKCMSEVHTEVVNLKGKNWTDWINQQLPQRGLTHVLIGETEEARLLKSSADESLQFREYDQAIESWKAELFQKVDVAITNTPGAIAETGSLILWPDAAEPRLMSLVPSVHIALVKADTIYETFAQVVVEQNWAQQMPTNALLISGPSKTADIEQTLAYGIHGPQQLIVLIID